MTYQMKIAEEREEAKAEGENRLAKLMALLLKNGKIQGKRQITERKHLH